MFVLLKRTKQKARPKGGKPKGELESQFQFILLSTNKIISPKAAVVARQATTNLCGELSLK